MFRIRSLTDAVAPANQRIIAEIQQVIRDQFPLMEERDIAKLPDQIGDPYTHGFITRVLVAENGRGLMRGFAIVMVDPQLQFMFLELISTPLGATGSGVGAALYADVRRLASERGLQGIYFECLPDGPELSPDPAIRVQNIARLRFYERFGAYPIMGTLYEMPVTPGTPDSPFLVFDGLGEHSLPPATTLREIIDAILVRKYAHLCPPDYCQRVRESINDHTLHLRTPRYRAKAARQPLLAKLGAPAARAIPLVINDGHDIHHVRERGYVEAPARIGAIRRELDRSGLFQVVPAKAFGDRIIRAIHDPRLVSYIERACAEAPPGKSIYPYVFPVRNARRMPKDRSVLAGYWCIDTFTPIHRNAYPAARGAVDCALTAAQSVLDGAPAAYALVRPPGHHAESKVFGGFCYFNNAAAAAHYLSQYGRVAVLDIDYHHGNGTQDIFYQRADVLTVSIHGDPSFAYPYFTGFRDERGLDEGAGYNLNLPLAEHTDAPTYLAALEKALARVDRHKPAWLVVALGLDTAKNDPTGTWQHGPDDFRRLGERIASTGLPCVFVQEGGYRVRNLGLHARAFFEGVAAGIAGQAEKMAGPTRVGKPDGPTVKPPLTWRDSVQQGDEAAILAMVNAAGNFSVDEAIIAQELVQERIAQGRASGYEFIIAERGGDLAGYACYGKTPGTEHAWDLYWIVVATDERGGGLARELLARIETAVKAADGHYLLAETSSAHSYAAARGFYATTDFEMLVEIPDFYKPGDNKWIFRKTLT